MAKKTLEIPSVINGEYEYVAADSLKPHPRNVRQADVGAIHESIRANGFYGACVVQKSTRHILVGNHRWYAAKQAGLPSIPVIWADVDDDSALRVLLADNQTGDLATNDNAALAELLAELAATDKGLAGTAYDGDDLDQLISDLAGMPQSGLLDGADADAVPDASEVVTRCKAGDLWRLGRHLLLCGDSTKAEDVARLMDGQTVDCMLTDPPYGIGGTESKKNNYDIHVDSQENLVVLIAAFLPIGQQYVERTVLTPGNANQRLYPKPSWTMAWFTPAGTGSGPWGFCCWQPILCYGKDPRLQNGEGRHPDAIVHTESADDVGHPCSKPVKFWTWLMERVTAKNGGIYDPFNGSGTGILAAETLARNYFGMEMSPHYVDVTLTRWEKATGMTAELIEHGKAD